MWLEGGFYFVVRIDQEYEGYAGSCWAFAGRLEGRPAYRSSMK